MISLSLLSNAAALRRLKAMRDIVRRGMARAVAEFGNDLKDNVRQNRLSGFALHSRSGPLKCGTAGHVDRRNARVSATVMGYFNAAMRDDASIIINLRKSLHQTKEAFRYPVNTNEVEVGAFSGQMQTYLGRGRGNLALRIRKSIKDALH
jgi:hypothetical protein